ncbi:hypothetical protein CRYUN_Cryun26dG0038300 [Craigia yunnanensis]
MFVKTTFPALQNIQAALIKAGLGKEVKVTIPLNADVYQTDTGLPSGGNLRPDIHDLMINIIKFLQDNGVPLTINIHPFLSLQADTNFPKEYAFFNNTASPLVDDNARRFNQALPNRIIQGYGSPRRRSPTDVYIFSLIDEDNKSVEPGNFERHWGIFNYDGSIKYPLDMGNGRAIVAKGVKYLARQWCVLSPSAIISDPNLAQSISYACQYADCTSLGYGSSSGNLNAQSNASYAFNMYYQTMNQRKDSCSFSNLSVITNMDPSQPPCRFEIMINTGKHELALSSNKSSAARIESLLTGLILVLPLVFCGVH